MIMGNEKKKTNIINSQGHAAVSYDKFPVNCLSCNICINMLNDI